MNGVKGGGRLASAAPDRHPDRALAGELLDRVCEDAPLIDAPDLVERAHRLRERG